MRRVLAAILLLLLCAALATWFVASDDDRPGTGPTHAAADDASAAPPAPGSADTAVAGAARPSAPTPRDGVRARAPTAEPPPAGPDPPPAPPDPNTLILGIVKFADGRPVAGATVRAWDASATYGGVASPLGGEVVTGEDGRFQLPAPDQDRQIVVYAKLAGFHTGGTVAKKGPGPAEITVVLGDGGTLTGTVRDRDGAVLADTVVQLLPARRWEHHRESQDWRFWSEPGVWEFFSPETRTDAKGRYEFRGVPLPRKVNEPRVAVVTGADDAEWASDEIVFAAKGERVVRDVTVGTAPFSGSVDPPGVWRRVHIEVAGEDGETLRAEVRYASIGPEKIRWWEGGDGLGNTHRPYVAAIPPDVFINPDDDLRISISAPGYDTLIFRPDRDAMTVTLRRSAGDAAWGRIAGRLVDGNGRAVAGVLTLQLVPLETFDAVSVGAVADAEGAFVVEGLAPGDYLAGIEERRNWQELTIGGGGTTSALFRLSAAAADPETADPAEADEDAPDPGADVAADEVAAAEARLREILLRQATEELTEGQRRGLAEELQQIEETLTRSFRGRVRAVEITGVSPASAAVVVAECDGTEWRTVVSGGVARFPHLPCGVWDFALRGSDTAEVTPRRLRVDPGSGTLRLKW